MSVGRTDQDDRDLSSKTLAKLDGYNAILEIIAQAKRVIEEERSIKKIRIPRSFRDELSVACEKVALSSGEEAAYIEVKKMLESWLDSESAKKIDDNEKKVERYRLQNEHHSCDEMEKNEKRERAEK